MNNTETVNRLTDIVRKEFHHPKKVQLTDRFEDDLGANSLDMMMLTIAVEDEFGVMFDEELNSGDLSTVKDLVDFVDNLLSCEKENVTS